MQIGYMQARFRAVTIVVDNQNRRLDLKLVRITVYVFCKNVDITTLCGSYGGRAVHRL